jgi:hypothetical protein
MKKGNYNFGTGSRINPTWDPAYPASITADTFYLPVIMTTPTTGTSVITGASNVTVDQTLEGWLLEFFIGDGTHGTEIGWGYIRGLRVKMKKTSKLNWNGIQDNGTYPNPVSVLYTDTIYYELQVYNPGTTSAAMTVRDTLPPYLEYVTGTATTDITHNTNFSITTPPTTSTSPQVITWTTNPSYTVGLNDTVKLTYKATPASGACASQPLFINKAYVEIGNPVSQILQTNSTYHQGAGIAVTTFSASFGGTLFGAGEQALDYRTSPRAGVLIVPDEGYEFAGWSHDDYTSLRGETIKADSGIMHYEDIVIYGNVELRANFVPVTTKSVEKDPGQDKVVKSEDKVWSADENLYIRVIRKGTIARIYTTTGVLLQQKTITADGITTIPLERGIYVVTLDGGAGYKVIIE